MAGPEDLERRVTALEERLDMEAGLRAGGDCDPGDIAQTLRAQQHTIQALAVTQSQHTQKLDQHTELLNQHELSLNAPHGKLDQIVGRLTHLIDRDTRGDG